MIRILNNIILFGLVCAGLLTCGWTQEIKPIRFKPYSNSFQGYTFLDSVAKNCDLILIGEKHRKKGNYPVFLKTFKYLNEQHNYNQLVIEYGTSVTYLINRYLEGDDKAYQILDQYVFTEDAFYIWLKELKKYHRKNPGFRVTGIDLELQDALALKVLSDLFPKTNTPEPLVGIIQKMDSVLTLPIINRKDFEKCNAELITHFFSHKKVYKSHLADQFGLFEKIVSGIDKGLEYRKWRMTNINKAYHYREHYMFLNMQQLLQTNAKEKVLAQLGQIHVMKSNVDQFIKLQDWKSLSMRLAEKKYRLFSLSFIYARSMNHLDKEVLGEEVFHQVKQIESRFHYFIPLDNFSAHKNFDALIYNSFSQPEKDPSATQKN